MAGSGCPEWGRLPKTKGRHLWCRPVSCHSTVAHTAAAGQGARPAPFEGYVRAAGPPVHARRMPGRG
ncbi:hypothetical protein SAM23877_7522 [Streptomyces ambofaciens ATCC 23877]|uniref:Uncharacterized protein n=1 Tax=Streptomyces ambofaciens (strain ATCC 23877 / 3486 / DSM 40053 / JCM 4204 / NBRC 12836 / NRRL B-2516) TaxID=278992 RepID=A0A0K2B5R1_STRA7|nr:hypothetical protein SAM23877_0152 [Streptomyces ambofaciens ATCC 23877]AKZ60563.1 hypothetical protein SAM23877_7522 [Streptomyces ambofaciens ATCC 23877]